MRLELGESTSPCGRGRSKLRQFVYQFCSMRHNLRRTEMLHRLEPVSCAEYDELMEMRLNEAQMTSAYSCKCTYIT